MLFDKLLVTTDLSEASEHAFDIALYQAKICEAKLVLMSVFDEFSIPPVLRKQISDPELAEKLKQEYEDEQRAAVEAVRKGKFHGHDVETQVVFTEERPSHVIAEYAKKEAIGMIIISSQGKGALKRLVMGSTVQNLVGEAACPILVIPSGAD